MMQVPALQRERALGILLRLGEGVARRDAIGKVRKRYVKSSVFSAYESDEGARGHERHPPRATGASPGVNARIFDAPIGPCGSQCPLRANPYRNSSAEIRPGQRASLPNPVNYGEIPRSDHLSGESSERHRPRFARDSRSWPQLPRWLNCDMVSLTRVGDVRLAVAALDRQVAELSAP
jgi:hypothetical protein